MQKNFTRFTYRLTMIVIFLCAGYATRLYPLTENQPKSLLPVAGEPILNHLLRKFDTVTSVNSFHVVSNDKFYKHFQLWKDTQKKSQAPIHVWNDETTSNDNRLGAIRDIQFVIQKGKLSDDIVIVAGDNLFDGNLSAFVSASQTHKPHGTVGVFDIRDLALASRYGLISHDSTFKVTAFEEKPKQPKSTLVSMGLYFFTKENIRDLNQYITQHQNPDAPGHFVSWLAKHKQIYAFPFRGAWYDVGDFESYQRAQDFFSKRTQH